MSYYCNICHKTIIDKSRNKHNKTKRHYFKKNYVTNIYNYKDIVWGDVGKILHENIISHNNKFNEFRIIVLCKVNDDIKIEVYKTHLDLCALVYPFTGIDTLYVHIAGKKISNIIRENLTSRYDNKCTHNMHIKSLSIKFISRYGKMTYRYQLEQPRSVLESKIVNYIKYMSHEEQVNNYISLNCKYRLSLL